MIALLPGFVSFLVIALNAMGLDPSNAVRWGSGTLAVVVLGPWAVVIRARAGLDDDERGRFVPWISRVSMTIIFIVVATQIYNVVIAPSGAFGVLILGLALSLVMSGAMFTGMVWSMMGYQSEEAQAQR